MNRQVIATAILIAATVHAAGCAREQVVPERLEGRVDRDLRYVEVKDNPEAYRGKLMLAGGKVLSAKRLEQGTRIEVLQFPLSNDLIPEARHEQSHGRFVAMDIDDQHIVDPAVLGEDKLITLVGEVLGTATVKVGEVEEQVPKLAIKHVTLWDPARWQPYYGYRSPYAWGYGPYYGRALYW